MAECTVENLFVVRCGELVTPPVTEGALDGITRQCVIELATKARFLCAKPPSHPLICTPPMSV